ncbi:N-acetylneuraminate synthase [bacterium]|nr:N-acetylneuraminate synthase [bacterium]
MKSEKTLIIAEAGVNHNGNIQIALDLINAASDCGADIIKFQTFKANNLILKNTKKTDYQIINTKSSSSQYEMLKSLEITELMHEKILNHCIKKNIEFLSSAFDIEDLEYLVKLGIKRIKVPSGEITNLPYLEKVATYDLPIIVSTGMSNMNEIKECHEILRSSGINNNKLTFLHCTSNYPAKLSTINLNAMKLISDTLNVTVGYSDHSSQNETSITAVALGAKIIEKHITLDKNLDGPDHKASSEPYEFRSLVQSIRMVEEALGKKEKLANPIELKNALLVRKSIVAAQLIKKGELFSKNNLTTKRPGNGVSPMLWYSIIGNKASKDYKINEQISYEN